MPELSDKGRNIANDMLDHEPLTRNLPIARVPLFGQRVQLALFVRQAAVLMAFFNP